MEDLPTKALSVRQPWAWAIIHGGKDVENRSWQAVNHGLHVRGRIAIHAAKRMSKREYEDAAEFMASISVECPAACSLWRGAIIGFVDVVDVVRESASPWFFGPRGLVLENPESCLPCGVSGALGYFNWQERKTFEVIAPARWMLSKQDQSKPRPQQGSLF